MEASTSTLGRPIKVGVIAELTGPLSFMGLANANVAKMVIDDINAGGGLLGQQVELYVEDGETTDSVAAACAAKLVNEVQADVVLGGIYSSTRQAIKGPAVVEGKTLYIYPEQYEGQESDPLIFCTGPVPAQQVDPLIPWIMERTGAKKFALPSADYIWPRVMNEKVRQIVTARGGEIVEEDYYPMDQADYGETVEQIMSGGAEVVFNTIVPPGVVPFFEQLYDAGFTKQGGQIVCTYFDENCLGLLPDEQTEGLYGCLDYYQAVGDPGSRELLQRYEQHFSGSALFTGGSAMLGHVPRPAVLGDGGPRGRLARPGRRHRSARPREDRRRARRPGRDGPGPAPRAHEHVHRPGAPRGTRGRREPRGDRPR